MSELAFSYPLTKEPTRPSFYDRYESEIAGLAAGLALMTPLFMALAKQELIDNASGAETSTVIVHENAEFTGHLATNNVVTLAGPTEFGQTESVIVVMPQDAE